MIRALKMPVEFNCVKANTKPSVWNLFTVEEFGSCHNIHGSSYHLAQRKKIPLTFRYQTS